MAGSKKLWNKLLFRDYYCTWILFRDYYVAFQGLLLYLDCFQELLLYLDCFQGLLLPAPLICLGVITVLISGIITTPLICMGIITVFHFRDFYYPPISGIIPPPHVYFLAAST
jgi:hypothetical protein